MANKTIPVKLSARFSDIRIRGKRIFGKTRAGERYVYCLPQGTKFPSDTGTRNLIRRNFQNALLIAKTPDEAEFFINGYLGVSGGKLELYIPTYSQQ